MGQVPVLLARPWMRRALLVVLVIDVLAAGGTLLLHANDRTVAFSADDAVAEFRQADGAAGADREGATTTVLSPVTAPVTAPVRAPAPVADAAGEPPVPTTVAGSSPTAGPPEAGSAPEAEMVEVPPFPDEGVYVYETTGFEAVDALGGSRHDYPDTTTIVHRRAGCGSTETWQPFEDRKDVRQLCGEPGRHRLAWFDASRAFFGRRDTRRLACDEGATAFVAGAAPGSVYEFRCVDDTGTQAANRLEILGVEHVVVGGERIEAVHSVATSEVSGSNSGTSRIESWVDRRTGLTLRRMSVLDGRSPSPGGDVSYHEEYTLVLTSLEPRR